MAEASRAGGWIAGVDGCPAGWIAVVHPLGNPVAAEARLLATFSDVLAMAERPRVVAIDIPIGLPARAIRGGRRADVEARSRLGARRSSVFAVPARSVAMEREYWRACAVASATSDPPRRVSKQTYNLFPKIREVDALMTPRLQERVFECHPELAFWALNGERALELPKKVKSRPSEPGLALRRRLLAAAGYAPAFLAELGAFRRGEAGPDDLLDAAACAWSAARIAEGQGRGIPDEVERDERGLAMQVWC
jgi:predicted RNase H-like nuclease